MLSALFLVAVSSRHSIVGTWDWLEDGTHSNMVFQAGGTYCRYRAMHPGYLVNRGKYTLKGDLLTLHGTLLSLNGRTMRTGEKGPGEPHRIKWDSRTAFHWTFPGRKPHSVVTVRFKRLSGRQDLPSGT